MAWCATHFSHLDLLTQRYTMLAVPSIRQDEVSLYDIILGGSKFQFHIFLSHWIEYKFFTLFLQVTFTFQMNSACFHFFPILLR